jgi:hypothetical protein
MLVRCLAQVALFVATAAASSQSSGVDTAGAFTCGTTFDTMAFEGGGVRGVVYGGVAIALEEAGLLDRACNFAGTSAGSSSSALLAVGYTACEVKEELRTMNFLQLVLDKETPAITTALRMLGYDVGSDSAGLFEESSWLNAFREGYDALINRKGLVCHA